MIYCTKTYQTNCRKSNMHNFRQKTIVKTWPKKWSFTDFDHSKFFVHKKRRRIDGNWRFLLWSQFSIILKHLCDVQFLGSNPLPWRNIRRFKNNLNIIRFHQYVLWNNDIEELYAKIWDYNFQDELITDVYPTWSDGSASAINQLFWPPKKSTE